MNNYSDSNVFHADLVIYLQIRGHGFFFLFWCREILTGTEYFTEVWKNFTALAPEQCTKAYREQLFRVEFLALFLCMNILEIGCFYLSYKFNSSLDLQPNIPYIESEFDKVSGEGLMMLKVKYHFHSK